MVGETGATHKRQMIDTNSHWLKRGAGPESWKVRASEGLTILQKGKVRSNMGPRLTHVHTRATAKCPDPHPNALPSEL